MAREKTQFFCPFSFFKNFRTKTHHVEDPEIEKLCNITHERSIRVAEITKRLENYSKELSEQIDQFNERNNIEGLSIKLRK